MGTRRSHRLAIVVALAALAIGIVAVVNAARSGPGPHPSTSSGAGSAGSPAGTTGRPTATRAARTFYVSSAGSDAADGSAERPWRTVAMVNSVTMVPGDTVLFAGGETFTDSPLLPLGSGSAGNPVVYGSYGSGQARITHGVYFFNRDYLTFQDLALGPQDGFQGGSGADRPADHVVIQRCTIGLSAGDPSVGIYSDGDGWTITGNTISQIGNSGMLLNGDDYTITGNKIHDVGLDPAISYGKHGIYLLVSNARISDNDISRYSSDGISARRRDSTIVRNRISDGPVGIAFYEYDRQPGTSRWTGNVITGTTVAGIYVNGGSGGQLPTLESFVIRANAIRPAAGVVVNLDKTSGHYSVGDNGG